MSSSELRKEVMTSRVSSPVTPPAVAVIVTVEAEVPDAIVRSTSTRPWALVVPEVAERVPVEVLSETDSPFMRSPSSSRTTTVMVAVVAPSAGTELRPEDISTEPTLASPPPVPPLELTVPPPHAVRLSAPSSRKKLSSLRIVRSLVVPLFTA